MSVNEAPDWSCLVQRKMAWQQPEVYGGIFLTGRVMMPDR